MKTQHYWGVSTIIRETGHQHNAFPAPVKYAEHRTKLVFCMPYEEASVDIPITLVRFQYKFQWLFCNPDWEKQHCKHEYQAHCKRSLSTIQNGLLPTSVSFGSTCHRYFSSASLNSFSLHRVLQFLLTLGRHLSRAPEYHTNLWLMKRQCHASQCLSANPKMQSK